MGTRLVGRRRVELHVRYSRFAPKHRRAKLLVARTPSVIEVIT
jgi:hypothetical protein